MAVSMAHWFDYEVTLASMPDGSLRGRAVSVQAAQGLLPGLAGSRPSVRVLADEVLVEADPSERLPSGWLRALLGWVPLLHQRSVERALRSAQVQAFRFVVPALREQARSGAVLHLRRSVRASFDQPARSEFEVSIVDAATGQSVWSQPEILNFEALPWSAAGLRSVWRQ
jgi:hypothetical protein